MPVPTFLTARLHLRPFAASDLARLVEVAGQRSIADTTISVPFPFGEPEGCAWISRCTEEERAGEAVHRVVALCENPDRLVGYAGIRDINREHEKGELSFWMDQAHSGAGYATEAGRAMIEHAFDGLALNRIDAHFMQRNPASGRVLAHLGFRIEGLLRQHVRKWGVYEDVCLAALLRKEWNR